MKMLHDYEIQKQPNLLIAILKLLTSVLVIYSALLIVPTFIDNITEAREQANEQLKIRVIANSSTKQDQLMKLEIVEQLQTLVANSPQFSEDIHSFEAIYQEIQKNYPQVNLRYEFGDNLVPPKWQFGKFYPQDEYYSVNFIIGQGRGENWFCSVFPTLCAPKQQEKQEQPTFYISEWWQKKKHKNNPQISENYPQVNVRNS